MSVVVHLVRVDPGRTTKRHSTCGIFVRVLRAGERRHLTDRYVGTERRNAVDCRACLRECLPGSHGGTTDPDSIDVDAI